MFLPTGSMCNQIALLVHIRTGGDELLIDRTACARSPIWTSAQEDVERAVAAIEAL
jgi:hypothetical protein